eukprot:scaffold2714_cov123-Isochrysis_galbana.AAC.5
MTAHRSRRRTPHCTCACAHGAPTKSAWRERIEHRRAAHFTARYGSQPSKGSRGQPTCVRLLRGLAPWLLASPPDNPIPKYTTQYSAPCAIYPYKCTCRMSHSPTCIHT